MLMICKRKLQRKEKTNKSHSRTIKEAKKLKFEVKYHKVDDKIYTCWLDDYNSEAEDKQRCSTTATERKESTKDSQMKEPP